MTKEVEGEERWRGANKEEEEEGRKGREGTGRGKVKGERKGKKRVL